MAKIAIFATTYLLFCIFGPFLTLFLDPIFGPPVKSCPGGVKRGSGMSILCLRIRRFLERPVSEGSGTPQGPPRGGSKKGSILSQKWPLRRVKIGVLSHFWVLLEGHFARSVFGGQKMTLIYGVFESIQNKEGPVRGCYFGRQTTISCGAKRK